MKLVIATIRVFKLEDVQAALAKIGITWFNVIEAKRSGPHKGPAILQRGAEYSTSLVPKVKVELVVSDSALDEVVDTIARSARTNEPGDGEIIVTPVDLRMGIHTGKTYFKTQ